MTLWDQYYRGDWPGFDVRILLGEALIRQRRYAEAEPLLLAGYTGLVGLMGKEANLEPSDVAAAADRLAELYTALGNPAEAAKWQAERAKYPPEQAPRPREKVGP